MGIRGLKGAYRSCFPILPIKFIELRVIWGDIWAYGELCGREELCAII
jgi:hypothetical protein